MDVKLLVRNMLLLLVFGLLQVLFINNITISRWDITPFIYIAAILLFPFETPVWFRLTAAFALGLSVDIFSDTGGMHAFSSVLIAFLRPPILNVISPREGYEYPIQPLAGMLGFGWFLKYTLILTGIHHLSFFILDAFSLSLFFMKFHVLLLSYIASVSLIVLSQFLIFRE